MENIVLDTCALIWWTLDPEKLSKKAKEYIYKQNGYHVIVSSISIWEIGLKIKNKKLDINMTIESYVDKLNMVDQFEIVSVTEKNWIYNLSLDWFHKDPADRTIVALAQLNEAKLITSDIIIRNFYSKSIW